MSHPMISWEDTVGAIWRPTQQRLKPVHHMDPIQLGQLVGIDRQKQALKENTERFVSGLPANHALLWGARGTGKSSLVKAMINAYADRGLRVIEVDKDELLHLPDIVDDIRDLPFRFIVFCDDLSFEAGESGYKSLKSVLEGSIELPPDNVLIYATSNRRHLIPEHMKDNLDSQVVDGELHYSDGIEEKISLSDRFGLWLSFHPSSYDGYLAMVDGYFPDFNGDRGALHQAAKLFAMGRAAKSGRTAKQFFLHYSGKA